jgi:hypothetical protein
METSMTTVAPITSRPSQVCEEIDVCLRADPDVRVVVSPGWADNTNVFIPFFIGADRRDRVTIQDIDDDEAAGDGVPHPVGSTRRGGRRPRPPGRVELRMR